MFVAEGVAMGVVIRVRFTLAAGLHSSSRNACWAARRSSNSPGGMSCVFIGLKVGW